MSRENVDIVRQSFEAANRNDAEAMAALCDPEVEFVSFLSAVEYATYRGKDGWQTYFRRMSETWEEWQFEDLEVYPADNEHLASVFRVIGTGKGSGARTALRVGVAYTFRDGRIWRMRSYLDPREALEAVGLSE
jgi:ketosteroid isomerase-like protein